MNTLCMDSSHKHLIVVLLENGEIKTSSVLSCWKKQSETLFPELIKCMEVAGWEIDDINEVFITDGPGSYTGVRIAMSVAKVLCTSKQLPLFCISTLQLYAGLKENAFVMLDARSNRAYIGHYSKGILVQEEQIWNLDEIDIFLQKNECTPYGDSVLINQVSKSIDFAENFKNLLPFARSIENIHTLTPRYLKEQDAYKVNK